MRNIRKVNVITFTLGNGDDAINHREVYESEANAAGRMNLLMNRDIVADYDEMFEVGSGLGTYAGTLVSSLESAERIAEHKYGEAVL